MDVERGAERAGDLPDPIITPEIFAQSVVDDYNLAPSYHAIITKSIQEQLSDYKAHSATFGEDGVMIDEPEDVLSGRFSEEELVWWEAWRKRVRSKALYKLPAPAPPEPRTRKRRKVVKDEPEAVPVPVPPSGDVPMTVEDFEEDESLMHEEMRILVKVRVCVGSFPKSGDKSVDPRVPLLRSIRSMLDAWCACTVGHHRRLVQA